MSAPRRKRGDLWAVKDSTKNGASVKSHRKQNANVHRETGFSDIYIEVFMGKNK